MRPTLAPFRRHLCAATTLLGLALGAGQPAAAADLILTCPRTVQDQSATMVFDLQQLDIASGQGEIDHKLELQFFAYAKIRQLDPARPGWVGPVLCQDQTSWTQDVPELDIINEGYMRYGMRHRVLLRNVPRFSVVEFEFHFWEEDDFDTDWADLNPSPQQRALILTLWPNDRTGRTPQATGNQRDLTFGRRKRVVGDGHYKLSVFPAAVEFTISMGEPAGAPPAVGGAIGGPPPPKVGGAIPTPGSRDPGLPGSGQPLPTREAKCRDYAEQAVIQNAQQIQMNCGYKPPVWNSDPNAHYTWCMAGNNVAQADGGWLMREAGLANCRAGNP